MNLPFIKSASTHTAMKISPKSYAWLKDLLKDALRTLHYKNYAEFKEKHVFKNIDRAKDKEKRMRWDLFYLVPHAKMQQLMDVLYKDEDLNDAQVDTALRDIVKSL